MGAFHEAIVLNEGDGFDGEGRNFKRDGAPWSLTP